MSALCDKAVVVFGVDPLTVGDYTPYELKLIAKQTQHRERSREYASYIMESIVTGIPYKIGGNVLNQGLISNLPEDACVEVPCLVDNMGVHPCRIGRLPVQLAALNMTNINAQLMTIEAAVTKRKEAIYQAAFLDPHTAAELTMDEIVAMCDEMIQAHGEYMKDYH